MTAAALWPGTEPGCGRIAEVWGRSPGLQRGQRGVFCVGISVGSLVCTACCGVLWEGRGHDGGGG